MLLLTFSVQANLYGVTADTVVEVVRAVAVVPLPGAPRIVEGVFNYRGRLVPLLDFRSRFGHDAQPLHPDDHFVIAGAGQRVVAIRADRVHDVTTVDEHSVTPVADVAPGMRRITGLASDGPSIVLIHDLETFLTAAEADDTDRALSAAKGL